ncbi:hypothetical protein QOZ80_6BG0483390 [Eleusine coracana subsp. coracana]|nr:hypothetical protein QOZ80_6BG0483390 [Eleusine coracana subsp. coracana]
MTRGEKLFFFLIVLLVSVSIGGLLYTLLFPGVTSVEVTVDEASLGRLALVAPGNGTASIAYNLSVAVAVRNPNWPSRVWLTGPLDAELRLAGHPFALVRLLASSEEDDGRIRPLRSKVYRVAAAAARSAPMELGSDAAAAFARESAVGMFRRLDLVVSGEFKFEGCDGTSFTTVRCPLRLPLSTAPAAVAFARFERTLPQPCTDISDN